MSTKPLLHDDVVAIEAAELEAWRGLHRWFALGFSVAYYRSHCVRS